MRQQAANCYFLPARARKALLANAPEGLDNVATDPGRSRPFTILDCFDQSLRKSGRLLIESEGALHLLTAANGQIQQATASGVGFISDFDDGPVKDALSDLTPLRRLLPVGSGDWAQQTVSCLDEEQKTQARLRINVFSGTGGKATAVVILSGLRGYDKAFDALRDQIVEQGGVPLVEGGLYTRLFPGHVPYNPKPVINIAPEEPAFDAATKIIASCIPVARVNEAGICDDIDTEFLHDYRIALRKIRSVLSLFRGVYETSQTDALKSRFSDLMGHTGRLRDLDVYLLDKAQFDALVPPGMHPGLRRMFELFETQRDAELKALRKHLKSKAYAKDVADLEKLFSTRKKLKPGKHARDPSSAFASRLIWKRYRKICEIAETLDASKPDEEVHELRIQCKKLRYLMEFFATVYEPGVIAKLLKPLKRLQDNLGLFNDYSVQQVSLQAFVDGLGDMPEDDKLQLAQSVGALIAVLHGKQLEERRKVAENFRHFNDDRTQKRFRDLFHDGKDTP